MGDAGWEMGIGDGRREMGDEIERLDKEFGSMVGSGSGSRSQVSTGTIITLASKQAKEQSSFLSFAGKESGGVGGGES